MSDKYIFVDDRPSLRSLTRGKTWRAGERSERALMRAMGMLGVNIKDFNRVTFFTIHDLSGEVNPRLKALLGLFEHFGWAIVAMGSKADAWMTSRLIRHAFIHHPAARGHLKGDEAYEDHVRKALASYESKEAYHARPEEPNEAEEDSGLSDTVCSRRGCGCGPQGHRRVDRGGSGGTRQASPGRGPLRGGVGHVSRHGSAPSSPYTPSHAPTVGGYL